MADEKKGIIPADKQAEIWFEKNWKKVLVVIVLVVIVGMVSFALIQRRSQQIENATRRLAEAGVGELPELLAKSDGIPGAAAARMRLAADLLGKKDFAAAKEQFSLAANDASAPLESRTLAKLSAAGCEEAAGNRKTAADAFLQIVNDNSVAATFRDEAGFQAGRILIALGEKARAKEILQKVAVTPAVSSGVNPWKSNAAALLKTLQ